MCHNKFWLDDKKTLNDMRNLKMPCVLLIWKNANVYNRDRDFLSSSLLLFHTFLPYVREHIFNHNHIFSHKNMIH